MTWRNSGLVLSNLKQAVSDKLEPLGITEIPETQVSSLLESLKARLKAWQDQVMQKAKIEKQIAGIDSEMKRLDAVIETQSNTLAEKTGTSGGSEKGTHCRK